MIQLRMSKEKTGVRTVMKMRMAFFIGLLFICSCKQKEKEQFQVVKVEQGTFYIDSHEEGELETIHSINVITPIIPWRFGILKITQIIKDGQEVAQGDTLLVFDPTEVLKGIDDAEDRLEISLAELERLKAQHQSDLEDLNANYKITQLSQEISKVQFESAIYESDIRKKEIQLNLDKADIALFRAKEQIENRIKVQREEIKQKNLYIEQDSIRLRESHETLNKLYVLAPSKGIGIIAINRNSQRKFEVGDQLWSGYPIIQLPNLSKMKAIVKINEVDIAKISEGLSVRIRPDAFSDSIFTGVVTSVANLAVSKDYTSKIKVFPIEIEINETNKNLLPGITVSCRILIDRIDDALFVPKDALHVEEGQSFVYKKNGKNYDKVMVETGVSNTDHVIITKGLEKDDEVALLYSQKENPNK